MTPEQLAKSGTEHAHQRALFAWANMAERYGQDIADLNEAYTVQNFANDCNKQFLRPPIPQLKWLHAIHNQGHGNAIRGSKAKAEGVKAGVWDIFLPVPNGLANGLYIEMKVGNNKLTDEQIQFRNDLLGWYVWVVCYSWQEARDTILEYLGLK